MTKDFPLKVKSVGADGTFSGLAAAYNNQDYLGDVILPGSFRQTIQQQGNGLPLLWSHLQSEPIGIGKVSDSPAGLAIDGRLLMSDPAAVRAHQHLKMGSVRGLSIGFSVPEGKADLQRDGTRHLREVRVHEVSLVAVPANPLAQVQLSSVKALSSALANVKVDDLKADDRQVLLAAMKKLLGAKAALCSCDCEQCSSGDCASCSDPDCVDENCTANQNDAAETLAALKALARELAA